MDTSNPVNTGELTTLGDFSRTNLLLKRQDYEELEKLVRDGKRVDPFYEAEEFEVDEKVVDRMYTSGIVTSTVTLAELPLVEEKESVLVSKYHPFGINQKGPHVTVNRTFPQRKRVKEILTALLKFNPQASEMIEMVTYSGGTPEGFKTRLQKWAHRKPRPMKTYLLKFALQPDLILEKRMPLKGELLDWHQNLDQLISAVRVNMKSGAGPPLFQPKFKCYNKIVEIIDVLAKSISDGTVDDLMKENRELLLGECKNKLDRYEMSKIREKTRPYWNFSAPVCILISILCQDFCKNLATFDENPKSANAYGFSWAHGGGQKLWTWMTTTKEKEMKFIAYGDDVKMVWRKEGKLYEINPDFEQMDGSIDKETVTLTVAWVVRKFEQRWGKSEFFEWVAAIWSHLAIEGSFLVHGTRVFNNNSGLRTGIVGTTLFDTVKSVLAYELFVHERKDPFQVEECNAFFEKMGLKIKPGTWKPILVLEELEDGGLASEEKFLGAQLVGFLGKDSLEAVPYIPEDDLVKLIGNLRQQEAAARQDTVTVRRLFDTARGYMITSAFHHPRVWSSLAYIIRTTPSHVIMQRVQANGGVGEGPELVNFVPEGFQWPSSDGFPTKRFCANVFLTPDNTFDEPDLWQYSFPELETVVSSFRKKKAYVDPVKEKDPNAWADAVEKEHVQEKIEEEVFPSGSSMDYEVLTKTRFKVPKNFSKFRNLGPEDKTRKEQKIANIVESFEEVHHQLLSALLPYGGFYISQQMLTLGFYPTKEGFWSRDAARASKYVTTVWGYDEQRAIWAESAEKKTATTSSELSEVADIPGKVVNRQPIMHLFDKVTLPSNKMDDVSFVSAAFVTAGMVLTTKSEVLMQNPNRVKIETHVKGGCLVGAAVDENVHLAKQRLFSQLRRVLEGDLRDPMVEVKLDFPELSGKESEKDLFPEKVEDQIDSTKEETVLSRVPEYTGKESEEEIKTILEGVGWKLRASVLNDIMEKRFRNGDPLSLFDTEPFAELMSPPSYNKVEAYREDLAITQLNARNIPIWEEDVHEVEEEDIPGDK